MTVASGWAARTAANGPVARMRPASSWARPPSENASSAPAPSAKGSRGVWRIWARTIVGISGPVEHDVLRALPEGHLAQRAQVLVALDHREEVVPGQLADDAREQAAAVGQEDLGLAEAAGVEEDLARRRVARVVLEADAELELAERDPRRLAAPAHVDDLLRVRQQLRERGAGLRRALLLEPRLERVRPGGDRQHRHGFRSPRWSRA